MNNIVSRDEEVVLRQLNSLHVKVDRKKLKQVFPEIKKQSGKNITSISQLNTNELYNILLTLDLKTYGEPLPELHEFHKKDDCLIEG